MDYNKKIIKEYIEGKYIDEDLLEELEDNTDFMIDVIEQSNDKKMYQFCSDNVLNDNKFVKYFIQKFSDDTNLIKEIADSFLKNRKKTEDFDYESIEINIIMEEIMNKKNIDTIEYAMSNRMFQVGTYIILQNEEKKEDSLYEGLGFNIIEGLFEGYDIIINYFAKQFINDIFYDKIKDFEKYIHSNDKNKEYLSNNNIDNFIKNFLEYYDSALANYLVYESELLNSLKKYLNKIYNRWEYMAKFYNRKKVDMFRDDLEKFYAYNEDEQPSFSLTELEASIVKNMKLEDIFNEVDQYKEDLYDCEIMKVDLNDAKQLETDFDMNNAVDCKFLKFAVETAKKIFFENKDFEFDLYLQKDKVKQKRKSMFFMVCIDEENDDKH